MNEGGEHYIIAILLSVFKARLLSSPETRHFYTFRKYLTKLTVLYSLKRVPPTTRFTESNLVVSFVVKDF